MDTFVSHFSPCNIFKTTYQKLVVVHFERDGCWIRAHLNDEDFRWRWLSLDSFIWRHAKTSDEWSGLQHSRRALLSSFIALQPSLFYNQPKGLVAMKVPRWNYIVLACYTIWDHNFISTFQGNLQPPPSLWHHFRLCSSDMKGIFGLLCRKLQGLKFHFLSCLTYRNVRSPA